MSTTTDVAPRRAARFVWLCWAALTLITGGLLLRFGVTVPFGDEWDAIVPFITAERPLTWETVWAPHNEHRVIVPRLILIGLDRLTGHEFRAGMFLSLLTLCATSAGLLWTIRKVRGHWIWTDAFFPALLLNSGHAENLIVSFQLVFVISGCLGCAAAAVFADCDRPSAARLACFGLILAVLPLCSAAGIVVGLAMVPYFVACLWYRRDVQQPLSRASVVIAGLFLVAIPVECALAFVPRLSGHPAATDVTKLIRDVVMESGIAFGPVIWKTFNWPKAAASLGLSAAVLWWLWRGPVQSPATRLARIGLALVVLAHIALALVIAWGRSGMGAALASRYFTLICPLLVAVYLAAVRYAPNRWAQVVTAGLCVTQLAFYPFNLKPGSSLAVERRLNAERFAQEVSSGVPLPELVQRYSGKFYPSAEVFEHQVRRLRNAKIGIFADITGEQRTADARSRQ